MSDTIEVLAIRAFYLRGRVIEAGTVASVPASDAAQVVGTGRAEYVNPADRELASAASRAEDARQCPFGQGHSQSFARGY